MKNNNYECSDLMLIKRTTEFARETGRCALPEPKFEDCKPYRGPT